MVVLLTVWAQATAQPTAGSQAPDVRVYRTYAEAAAAGEGKIPSLGDGIPYFDGYSLKPFRPKQAAFDEAVEKARKARSTTLLVVIDKDQQYPSTSPPPGSFAGGVYNVVGLAPVAYLEPTTENLLSELRLHVYSAATPPEHVALLLKLASEPQHRAAVPELKALVRQERSERMPASASAGLVEAVVAQESAAAADDLIRWCKYHKNPDLRLASYQALLKMGRTKDVEDLLRNEPDKKVRAQVERKLL